MIRYKHNFLYLIPALALLIFAVRTFQTGGAAPDTERALTKIDPYLIEQLQLGGRSSLGEVEFIVRFADEADLSNVVAFESKNEKADFVFSQLVSTARETQSDQRALLTQQGAAMIRPLWLINGAVMRGNRDALIALAADESVDFIYGNPTVALDLVDPEPLKGGEKDARADLQSDITWGIDQIDAELVWAAGVRGAGAVIGGQDTGYDWDHPALVSQYRGFNGVDTPVTHAYNWHDSIREDFGSNGNRCGFDIDFACDDGYHGTHTMGTMVGQADGYDIGVAPEAEWIGCRNMEEGFGKPSTYIECFEWFLAPTDLDGNNPDPSKGPHVINNSWGCPPVEGCNSSNFELMALAVDNLRAAGVVVVVSAGNSGSSCSTVSSPAAIFGGSFSVGATNSSDSITSFSSRGPVTVDGSNRLKPNIVAPGQNVLSSVPSTGYASLQGTSMAGPHVAGAVALLISADPTLAGEVDLIETILAESAVPLTTNQGCGGDSSTSVPNHVYGHGRLDAYAAYLAALAPAQRHLDSSRTLPLTVLVPETVVANPDMTVSISSTIEITNRHPISDLVGIEIESMVPEGGRIITGTGSFTESNGQATWNIASLGPGESIRVTLAIEIEIEIESGIEVDQSQSNSILFDGLRLKADQIAQFDEDGQTVLLELIPDRSYLPQISNPIESP